MVKNRFAFQDAAAAGGSVTRVSVDSAVLDLDNESSGSTDTVNIDASADYAVVMVCGYEGGTTSSYFATGSVTLGGSAMTYLGGATTASSQQVGIFGLVAPSTGASVSLDWDWAGAGNLNSGGRFVVVGVDGVNASTPTRDVDGSNVTGGANISLSMTCTSGDLIVALGASFGTGTETWSGVTQIGESTGNSVTAHWADATASGNTTVEFDTTDSFQGLGVVVLRP